MWAKQTASLRAQGCLHAYAEFGSFSQSGRRPLEMCGRDAGRNGEKVPKKSGLFRTCAGGSRRKLFLFLPIFQLLLYFSSFGVKPTLFGLGHSCHLLMMYLRDMLCFKFARTNRLEVLDLLVVKKIFCGTK